MTALQGYGFKVLRTARRVIAFNLNSRENSYAENHQCRLED